MQADLFNLSVSNSFERQAYQRSFFEHKYQFRFDQLLATGLVAIVFFVLVFAWGVEHGKAVSRHEYVLRTHAVGSESTLPTEASPGLKAADLAVTPSVSAEIEIVGEKRSEVSLSAPLPSDNDLQSAPVSMPLKYTIAHMTYVKKDQALKEIARLKSKGFRSFLIPSGRFFQICVDGFESRKSANEAIRSLRLKGIVSGDSYIRNMPTAR